jgi:tetratricopeptide (TPR) repeat protein
MRVMLSSRGMVMREVLAWRSKRLAAVLAAALFGLAISSHRGKAENNDGRPSGAIMLPPEFLPAANNPQLVSVLRQAFLLEDRGDWAGAIDRYRQAVTLNGADDPIQAPAFNSIAGCYGKLERFQDEVVWAKKATSVAPSFPEGYLNLGNGYAGLGDLDRASLAFTKYVGLRPNDPKGYYSLGLTADQQQDWSKAESFYQKSIAADPSFSNGHFNLAAAYANQRKFELAIGELQKVIALDPVNEDARAMLEEIKKNQ